MNNINGLATLLWTTMVTYSADLRHRARLDQRGLTTTEWALLVAGVAAIAIAVVAIVRATTEDIANNIPTG
jgi:hypothetical protein